MDEKTQVGDCANPWLTFGPDTNSQVMLNLYYSNALCWSNCESTDVKAVNPFGTV